MTDAVELERGQTWRPSNGERPRYIDDLRAVDLPNHRYRMGEIVVCWVATSDKWGWCRVGSFKAWIKRTGAVLK